jgi:hypothetical protein
MCSKDLPEFAAGRKLLILSLLDQKGFLEG